MPTGLSPTCIRLLSTGELVGTGWLPPMIDPRDYTASHPKIQPMIAVLKDRAKALSAPP
jgi:hypothetical protein